MDNNNFFGSLFSQTYYNPSHPQTYYYPPQDGQYQIDPLQGLANWAGYRRISPIQFGHGYVAPWSGQIEAGPGCILYGSPHQSRRVDPLGVGHLSAKIPVWGRSTGSVRQGNIAGGQPGDNQKARQELSVNNMPASEPRNSVYPAPVEGWRELRTDASLQTSPASAQDDWRPGLKSLTRLRTTPGCVSHKKKEGLIFPVRKLIASYPGRIKTACFSPDGNKLLIVCGEQVNIKRLDSGRHGQDYQDLYCGCGYPDSEGIFRFSSDSSCLVMGFDKTLHIIRPDKEGCWDKQKEYSFKNPVLAIGFVPDSRSLGIVAGNTVTIKDFDKQGDRVQEIQSGDDQCLPHRAVFSPDLTTLVLGFGNSVWIMGLDKSDSWNRKTELSLADSVSVIRFSPDGSRLAIAYGTSFQINCRDDRENWEQKEVYTMNTGCLITSLSFGSDGCELVAHSQNQRTAMFFRENGGWWKREHSFPCSPKLKSLECSPLRGVCVIANYKEVEVWARKLSSKPASHWELKTSIIRKGDVNLISHSPDGHSLVTVSRSGLRDCHDRECWIQTRSITQPVTRSGRTDQAL
ncbi:WD40 repeat domain-containing protein [Endozoicomonas sp.]|uniref:WD40 repeat domain-containing protein n=1 Tax=Endozoicomonas sp. TaxID=1892382 RepID=UPI002888A5FB|nr:WD40 repeat domain-containing protein [Endozoicomonas sp.]